MNWDISNEGILNSAPEGLEDAIIPKSVNIIYGNDPNYYAFKSCRSTLITVTFEDPSSIIEIQRYSFYSCNKLQGIDLSKCINLHSIGDYAFNLCTALESVQFPESKLNSIGSYSFSKSGVISIHFPYCLQKLGDYCFYNCNRLKELTFSYDSQIEILPQGFVLYCYSITSLLIPKNAKFNGNAIGYCQGILNFSIEEGNPYYEVKNGIIYSEDQQSIVYFPAGRTNSYVIESTIKKISPFAFCGSLLSEITIPEGVTSIGDYAFSRSSIHTFHFPSSLKSINYCCFINCDELIEISLPDGLKTIGSNLFQDCDNLKSVKFPTSLQNIGGGIFLGCKNNISIEFGNNSNLHLNDQELVTDIEETFISMYFGDAETIIIKNTVLTIKNSAFISKTNLKTVIFEDTPKITSIESSAFKYCKNLMTITLPDSILRLSTSAFENCQSIKKISLTNIFETGGAACFNYCLNLSEFSIADHQDVEYSLSDNFFSNCHSLKKITLGIGLKSIPSKAFHSCFSLEEINLPNTLETLDSYAFNSCYNLITIDMRSTKIISIGDMAFNKCYKLKSVFLSPYVEEIGTYSFSDTQIYKFEFPKTLTSIGTMCFRNCTSLTEISIPENCNLETIDNSIFTDCFQFSTIHNSCSKFKILNDALYNEDLTKFLLFPPNSPLTTFSFPETLTSIPSKALYGSKHLQIVFIPSSSTITSILPNAFEGCTHLQYINIPLSIESIGLDAFKSCNQLQCGLIIENRSDSFIDMLVNTAKFPLRSLKPCIHKCTQQNNMRNEFLFTTIHIFIILTQN